MTRDVAGPSVASAGSGPNDTANIFAKGIADIIRIAAEPDWIPVSERLPESGDTVLVWDCGEHLLAWLNFTSNGTAYFSAPGRSNFEVTHWMPIPAPPSDGK